MRSLALVVMLGSATALAAPAPGQPRMRPLVATPGVALPGRVHGSAFCDTSQRAVFRIHDGSVLAVDAAGTLAHLGNAGVIAMGTAMACDRADRVWVANGRSLVVLAPGEPVRSVNLALTRDIDHLRVLDDGTLGVVSLGTVYRFDGARARKLWAAGREGVPPYQLDGTGQRLVATWQGRAVVLGAAGTVTGPRAQRATWIDNATLLLADATGKLGRWAIDQPAELARPVAQLPVRAQGSFIRIQLHPAGARRVVVADTEGPLLALQFDARAELATSALVSRVPGRRSALAVGAAAFAVVTVNDRAIVVPDLATTRFLVDHAQPLGPVDALAFAPDGRALAMPGGDRDVLLVPLAPGAAARRLTSQGAPRSPLRWFPDGTLSAGFVGSQLWWSPDGHVEARSENVIGFTDLAQPILVDDSLRGIRFGRGTATQHFPIPGGFHPFRADIRGRALLVRNLREARRYELGAATARIAVTDRVLREAWLVGDDAILTLDDRHRVVLHAGAEPRAIAALARPPLIAVSPDGTRFAIATDSELALYDARGTRFDTLDRRARAIAWSPDGITLAVATLDAVELWTFPR